jgi:hypothetical protein
MWQIVIMTRWTHVSEGMQRVDWTRNKGLGKRLLRALISYYLGQFNNRWVIAAIEEACAWHGYRATIRKENK